VFQPKNIQAIGLACICPNSHMIDIAINNSESYNPVPIYNNANKLYKHKININ
jgi:hypothetical protein